MRTLLEGVSAFHEKYYKTKRELFERLAEGQQPAALFITCSDSRIDPNLLTQTEPGEIFVLRNAGNIVPPYAAVGGGEHATVEYAVAALNVREVVVCGHTNCGAMKAVLRRESVSGLPAVAAWLRHAEALPVKVCGDQTEFEETKLLDALIERNVLDQLENLRTHPAVAARLAEGTLRLHGWVYRIAEGDVTVYDPALSRFVPALTGAPAGQAGGRQQLSVTGGA